MDALLRAAFMGPQEAELVQRLRRDGLMFREEIKPWEGRIGAYAAISRMVAPQGWYCLGPVAILPEWQRGAAGRKQGDDRNINSFNFGTRLVREIADMFLDVHGLWENYRTQKSEVVTEPPTLVVLGRPAFYTRAGFSQIRAARLTSPYPLEHTLIARPGADVPEETLIYPAAFDGV
ncbi:MAG: N-acetyltransferase [Pseudomonadota bacterium]